MAHENCPARSGAFLEIIEKGRADFGGTKVVEMIKKCPECAREARRILEALEKLPGSPRLSENHREIWAAIRVNERWPFRFMSIASRIRSLLWG